MNKNADPLQGVILSGDYPYYCQYPTCYPLYMQIAPLPPSTLLRRHISKHITCKQVQLTYQDSTVYAVEVDCYGHGFWARIQDGILIFSPEKPTMDAQAVIGKAPDCKPLIVEGLYAVSHNPIALYRLLGEAGQLIGLYEDKVWESMKLSLGVTA